MAVITIKKVNYTYKGLIVPVFTPFNNDPSRSLNVSVVPDYAKFLVSKNIQGILVNGSTGEGTCLTIEERKKITEAWAAAVKETKQHLMIQVGGAALKDVKELAAHAESLGVDSILCLPELYFKPTTPDDLIEYLHQVAESAPSTPLFYYDFPKATMVNVDMGKFAASVTDRIPNFCGVKTDLERGLQAERANENLHIFIAGDMMMIAGCASGMQSYIMTSINFLPEPALELLEYSKGNSSLENARKNQKFINKVICEVIRHGAWVETMKIAMSLTTNIFLGPPRAPLKLLSKENVQVMSKGLNGLGLNINETAVIGMY
uniref:N-acetylneuraminate lyase n=1 Tax=Trichogramma kaykai TaxID=54128 RepID=A0ABD2VW42_9HYME